MADELSIQQIAIDISMCRKCDEDNISVTHTQPMERGKGSDVFVIGIEPGKSEIEKAEAFVGPAGKRLMEWLVNAGLGSNREEILEKCYLTSLCKCNIKRSSDKYKAFQNCYVFLERQVNLLKPKICLTLGNEPLEVLFNFTGGLDDVVGKVFSEVDFGETFFPLFGNDCKIIPLPHPSPLSRWLNSERNKELLEQAIEKLESVKQ